MPATVIIERYTGSTGSPTKTNITSANTVANAVDLHQATALGSVSPIQIPATAGPNYSFWVSTRLNITVAPSGSISNVRWYSDGTNNLGTGVTCKAAVSNVYATATGTVGVTGIALAASSLFSGLIGFANAFTYTSVAPLTVNAGSVSATGAFGGYVLYQIEVATTASPGVTAQETFTFSYDET